MPSSSSSFLLRPSSQLVKVSSQSQDAVRFNSQARDSENGRRSNDREHFCHHQDARVIDLERPILAGL